MVQISSQWRDASALRRQLVSSGWKTPNTYDNCYSPPIDGAAVYLFLLHARDTTDGFHDFDSAIVAYVGMSRRLQQRWAGHEVLREIQSIGNYVQQWFLPTRRADLRTNEAILIKKFDPPWNIQGRERGIFLP